MKINRTYKKQFVESNVLDSALERFRILFDRYDKVVISFSGGKDSTVLIHIMTTLNKRYDYGLNLELISVDEGIIGYRDDSLETVKKN